MPPNLFLSIRQKFKDDLISMVKSRAHIIPADTLDEAATLLTTSNFDLAMIDEHFCGVDTGWLLARKIREQLGDEVGIVMLAEKPHRAYFDSRANSFRDKVDWILVFPVSEEQILHEIERRTAS